MKRTLIVSVFSAFVFSAHADCLITSVSDEEVRVKFKKYGGWGFDVAEFNQLCEKLNQSNAVIRIDADSKVLGNHSIGWAVLSVIDRDAAIATSDFSSMHTRVSIYASQDKADEIMVKAINEAAVSWDKIDNALASLENERKKARSVFCK